MTSLNILRVAGLSTLMFVFAGFAAAQVGPTAGSSTTSELAMTANVQTTVQLNISQGSGGATVSGSNATGLFSINFGDVNAMGLGSTQSANVSVVANGTGALYSTPINLTPVFTGFTSETAAVSVSAGTDDDQALAREGATANSMVVPTVTTGAFSSAASGSNNERFVGFFIPRTEAAGTKTATIIYEVVVD